jgi:toxin YoeB
VRLIFSETAWSQYLGHTGRKLTRNGYRRIGKPEPLRGELSGLWSRRIDQEHRLVYRLKGDDVEIVSCRYHYGNR